MKNQNTKENLIHWLGRRSSLPFVPHLDLGIFQKMKFTPFVYQHKEIEEITASWDYSYLDSKIGIYEVDVCVSADHTFPSGKGPHDPDRYRFVSIPLSECLNRMRGNSKDFYFNAEEKYYLYQAPGILLEKLTSKIDMAEYIPSSVIDRNFWLSSMGNITPIHYDLKDNYLVQLLGTKRVLMWNPSCYHELEFNAIGQTNDRTSRLNPVDKQSVLSSKIPSVEVYEHRLSPGQVLYIPLGWPHFVYTESLAVSVNYWWDPTFVLELSKAVQSVTTRGADMKSILDEIVFNSRPDLQVMINGMQKDGGFNVLLEKFLVS